MLGIEKLKYISFTWFLFALFSISFFSWHIFQLFNVGSIEIIELKKLNSEEFSIKIKVNQPNSRVFIDEQEYIKDQDNIISAKLRYNHKSSLKITLKNDVGISRTRIISLNF